MTRIEFTSEITVKLRKLCACDDDVVEAMLVSTEGMDAMDAEASFGRINFLMSNRHGTPFEHNFFKFFVDAPIFVTREFQRHRIGFSYNEESGRYKDLRAKCYLPDADRALIQVGKPGHYTYVPGTFEQRAVTLPVLQNSYEVAFRNYQTLLGHGIAKEVARLCLPVSVYSSMIVSCNARSIMAFLSLRQKHSQRHPYIESDIDGPPRIEWAGEAMFPSFPMKEINIVADKMEQVFKEAMPITHAVFVRNGYVGP